MDNIKVIIIMDKVIIMDMVIIIMDMVIMDITDMVKPLWVRHSMRFSGWQNTKLKE